MMLSCFCECDLPHTYNRNRPNVRPTTHIASPDRSFTGLYGLLLNNSSNIVRCHNDPFRSIAGPACHVTSVSPPSPYRPSSFTCDSQVSSASWRRVPRTTDVTVRSHRWWSMSCCCRRTAAAAAVVRHTEMRASQHRPLVISRSVAVSASTQIDG